jgi:hypothetical protein
VNFDSSGFQGLGRGEQVSHNNPFQQQQFLTSNSKTSI